MSMLFPTIQKRDAIPVLPQVPHNSSLMDPRRSVVKPEKWLIGALNGIQPLGAPVLDLEYICKGAISQYLKDFEARNKIILVAMIRNKGI
jgi:hypothetical protein